MQTQPTTHPLDLRSVIRQELVRRCQRNPRYSQRGFARAAGLSHTVLSLFLSGKRPLSRKATLKVAEALSLDPKQWSRLYTGRDYPADPVTSSKVKDFDRISLDTFALLSDWYYYAVLSLLEIPGAKFESRWISRRLGITEVEAKDAIERLKKLDLVARSKTGQWKQTGKPIKVENKVSTGATIKYNRQLLEKAIDSLEKDPMAVRDFSSIVFAMDPSLIPYARERIRTFRRELCAELESSGTAKNVYHLAVQIYPVSRSMEKEK